MMKYPEDWKIVKLGEIGQLLKGRGISRSESNSGTIPAVRYGEIYTHHNDYVKTYVSYISKEVATKALRLKRGDVIFAGSGETIEEIGKSVAVLEDGVYAGGDTIVLSSIAPIDPIFLGSLLNMPFVQRQKTLSGQGATVVHISPKAISQIEIPLPSLAEQKRIAEVLENADQLIDNLEKRIAKKRAIKQGAMQELLTGKKRLPGFTGEWKMVTLGKLSTIKARIGWQGLTTAEYLTDGEYYLVNGINIEAGKVIWRKCFMVDKKRYNQDKNIQLRKHDVLVSKDGTIGKVAYVTDLPKLATLNSGVFVIRTTDSTILQEYLARIFLSKWFDNFVKKITAGSTIVHLYQKDIVGFSFMVPPTITEQRAIAKILSDMDDEISILERKLEKVKAVKQGMMQDLLTGKVRLRGQA